MLPEHGLSVCTRGLEEEGLRWGAAGGPGRRPQAKRKAPHSGTPPENPGRRVGLQTEQGCGRRHPSGGCPGSLTPAHRQAHRAHRRLHAPRPGTDKEPSVLPVQCLHVDLSRLSVGEVPGPAVLCCARWPGCSPGRGTCGRLTSPWTPRLWCAPPFTT